MAGRPFDLPPLPGRGLLAATGVLLSIPLAIVLPLVAWLLVTGLVWLVLAACWLLMTLADKRFWENQVWVAYPAVPSHGESTAGDRP